MLKAFFNRLSSLSHSSLKQEFTAGLTTFLTMGYILAVNPLILSSTGMDAGAVFVATCLAAALGSFLMGFVANYPIALAPSMSLNVYFAYIVVGHLGYPWQIALGAVFISGLLFALLTLTGVRQWLINFLPPALKTGIMAGIGLFLGLIGLKNLDLIALTPRPVLVPAHFMHLTVLLAAMGLGLIIVFERLKILGAIFISILIMTLVGILLHLVTYQGMIDFPPSIAPVFLKLQFPHAFDLKLAFATLIFLFVALFDNTGTLVAVLSQAQLVRPDGKIDRIQQALFADSVANISGALLGTSSTGSYIESATGVRAGGKTGLTAIFVSLFFLISLAFAPLVKTIPAYATAPALIYVAFLMAKNLKYLWVNWVENLPGLLTALAIPCTFSIAMGVSLGLVAHGVLRILSGKIKTLNLGMWILLLISSSYLVLQFK